MFPLADKASTWKMRLEVHLQQSAVHPVFMDDFYIHSIMLAFEKDKETEYAELGLEELPV